MNIAKSIGASVICLALAGCGGLRDGARNAIVSSVAAADGYRDANLLIAELTRELEIAHRAFEFTADGVGRNCIAGARLQPVEDIIRHEKGIFEQRKQKLVAFGLFSEYLKSVIEKKSGITANIDRLNTIISTINGSAVLGPIVQPLGFGSISSFLALVSKWNEDATDTRDILRFIRERRKAIDELIEDLIAGVRPMASEATALLKAWDTCQVNRIYHLRDHSDADRSMLDRAFTDHIRRVHDFEARLIDADALRKLLRASKAAYANIATLTPEQVTAGAVEALDGAGKAIQLIRGD